MLLNLSFQLSDPREVATEYGPQVEEIFAQIMDSGLNKSNPEDPGQTVTVGLEDISWMLVRDQDCVGNAEVNMNDQSIHIRFDQLDFKLAAVFESVVWKSQSRVRMRRPELEGHRSKLRLIEESASV